MSQAAFNPDLYAGLLANARPGVIESPEEHERLLTIAEELMDRGEQLSVEERKLLELLVALIQAFETEIEAGDAEDDDDAEDDHDADHVPLPRPHETLQRLLQSRGWENDTLADVFGNPYLTGEVLAGRRPISKGQAKALAKLFRVPVKLFAR